MMLFSLMLLGAQPPTLPAAPSPEFLPLKDDYEGCVIANAATFDDAKESVADTVKAAFAACKNERASIILMMNAKKKLDGSELWSLERADKFVTDLIDKPLADKVTVGLFSTRAKEK
jgi:hypothetical protein